MESVNQKAKRIHPAVLSVAGVAVLGATIAGVLMLVGGGDADALDGHGRTDHTNAAANTVLEGSGHYVSLTSKPSVGASLDLSPSNSGVSATAKISKTSGDFAQTLRSAPPAERVQIARDFLTKGMFQKTGIDPESGDELVYLDEQDIANGAHALVVLTSSYEAHGSGSGFPSGSASSLSSTVGASESTPGSNTSIESILEGLGTEATAAIIETAIQTARQEGGISAAFELVKSIKDTDLRQDATQILAGELLASLTFHETSQLFQENFGWPQANADGVVAVKARLLNAAEEQAE